MYTNDLIKKLGVSRNWINTYLRPLGRKETIPHPDYNTRVKVVVDYSEADVLKWFNEHAVMERQVVRMPYTYFGCVNEHEVSACLQKAGELESEKEFEKALKLRRELKSKAVPERIQKRFTDFMGNERRRIDPWTLVNDRKVESFDQLISINQLLDEIDPEMRSGELAYRYIYSRAMIRVTVCGRVWYIKDAEFEDCTEPMMYLPAYVF